jgi:hypothetical protein
MGILIGMDEAGYGPNFGPLVVAATAWHVPDCEFTTNSPTYGEPASAGGVSTKPPSARTQSAIRNPKSEIDPSPDLYRLLRPVVCKKPSTRRLAIADSKALYTPGLGLRQLERGLHAVLLSMQQAITCWSTIIEYCQADREGHHKTVCWPEKFDCPLPLDAVADELHRLCDRFVRACDSTGIRPLFIRAKLVFPSEFNDLTTKFGSKGAALSHVTVALLREVMDSLASLAPRSSLLAPLHVVCDKHGGRNFYTALLQHHFSEHWIEPVHESRAESRYEWGPPESRTRVAFRMNGERFLPTALASMTAKYLRELSMRAFNEFWSAHVADLRPTAGYPRDSHRFRKAIADAQRKLNIDDHLIWRNR